MAILNRNGNNVEVTILNVTEPIQITNWQNFVLNTQTLPDGNILVNIQFNPSQNYTFGVWKYSTMGVLTEVGGIDVTEFDADEIKTAIDNLLVVEMPDGIAYNSDNSTEINVPSGGSELIPDSQFDINGIPIGSVISAKTTGVNLFDDNGNTLNPDSITLANNKYILEFNNSNKDYVVRFFDIDGNILKEEWVNAGEDATPPTNTPDYDPTYLTFNSWNNTFTNVQHDIDVGAIYDTIDGKTYLFIRLTDTTGLQPTLNLTKADTQLLTIDWGDSTTNTTSSSGNLTVTKTAAYSAIGDYIVSIDCAGIHSTNYSLGYILGNNTTYSRSLLKCYMGLKFETYFSSFHNNSSLEIISISRTSTISNNLFINTYSLKHINFPISFIGLVGTCQQCYSLKSACLSSGTITVNAGFINCHSLEYLNMAMVTSLQANAVTSCFGLKKIVLKNSLTTFGQGALKNNYGLNSVNIPTSLITSTGSTFELGYSLKSLEYPASLTSLGSYEFPNCFSVLEYTFLSTTPPTLGGTNSFTNINAACKIYVPDASVAAYKAATNWITYAAYIYPLSTRP